MRVSVGRRRQRLGVAGERPTGHRPRRSFRRALAVAAVAGSVALTAACGGADATEASSDESPSASGTRVVEHEKGSTEIPADPQRVVSASVTLTGTLLALDVPVVASQGSQGDNAFFPQWADVAAERGVEEIPGVEISVEKIAAAEPDLIVAAGCCGQDDGSELYEELSAIAPTIVVSYAEKSWLDLTEELGADLGREERAGQIADEHAARVAEVKEAITLPEQPTSLYSVAQDGSANVFTKVSPQGELLSALGFEIQEATGGELKADRTVSNVAAETFADQLSGSTALIVNTEEEGLAALRENPALQVTPAFRDGEVYALGREAFRLDYYSVGVVLDKVEAWFGRG
ncbi:Fe2+-enterobactin ABC transporter substrate-binding protein [Allostreptomyces psammosilenae]|uniref:Iron complex transport system substrate-binding protein n=1 Tax=Allostreptomyces psammosilenae TaxID=1892865 RepID=A0A852ZYK8_9ACTN|nr:Fe2+-enterobactin ABC transporter substrate-binding protein [Allostreptomyces psammosilenae]NYI03178.1 iron complex transport system substrate-binding protein [Allostreptomyces psammosilenae]